MSLQSMLTQTMDVYLLAAIRGEAGDTERTASLISSGVACRVQPLSSLEITTNGQWEIPPSHKVYFERGTVLESKHRLKIGSVWYDVLAVEYASEDNWPSKALVERVSVAA